MNHINIRKIMIFLRKKKSILKKYQIKEITSKIIIG